MERTVLSPSQRPAQIPTGANSTSMRADTFNPGKNGQPTTKKPIRAAGTQRRGTRDTPAIPKTSPRGTQIMAPLIST